jgi:AAHS family 4-hydroxybenzoate transporter-like MFS transporter
LAQLRLSPRLFGILALCVAIATGEGYDVQVMALAAPLLAKSWDLTRGQVGLLLTASVSGILLGSVLLAPQGDRRGRRLVGLAGLLLGAIFATASAFATELHTLLPIRVLASLGVGCAMPNIFAIAMETAPSRWRIVAVVAVSCGYPLGSAVGGLVASHLAQHGYAGVFLVGGAIIALNFVMGAFWLPESPTFLAARRPSETRRLLVSLGASLADDVTFVAPPERPRSTISALFTPARRTTTILLWVLNFTNMMLVFFFISWLPSLLAYRGLANSASLSATSLFSASGVIGGISMAFAMRRTIPPTVLSVAYVCAACSVIALALLPATGPAFLITIAISGAAILGSQFCLIALVNHYYPPEIRVSGAGYAIGVGRLGALFAPVAGGILLSLVSAAQWVFLFTALPALIALGVVLTLRRTRTITQAV